jgi:phage related protein
MLEKDIEKALKDPIKELGGLCLKFEVPGFTGLPDRILLLPHEKTIFVETKAPGKKERKRQELVQAQLRALGYTVYSTVNSKAKMAVVINACKEAIQRECENV